MKAPIAAKILIVFFAGVAVFHILVLAGVVPYNAVWAGRIKTVGEMYVYETVSLLLNIGMMAVVLQRAGYIKAWLPLRTVYILLWVFCGLFALNTVGNLFAQNIYERILGTAGTLLAAVLCGVLARKPR
jgi:hypothetical protein